MFYHTGRYVCLLSLIAFIACKPSMDLPDGVKLAYDEIKFKPDYNIHIRPILSDRCFLCHGPDVKSRKAELDLSNRTQATTALPLNPSKKAIVSGNPAASELVARILSSDESWKMCIRDRHKDSLIGTGTTMG